MVACNLNYKKKIKDSNDRKVKFSHFTLELAWAYWSRLFFFFFFTPVVANQVGYSQKQGFPHKGSGLQRWQHCSNQWASNLTWRQGLLLGRGAVNPRMSLQGSPRLRMSKNSDHVSVFALPAQILSSELPYRSLGTTVTPLRLCRKCMSDNGLKIVLESSED